MFVDYVEVYCKGGDGGSGCISFRREKFVPRGGPDGGDGGKGGDVVLEADLHLTTLYDLRLKPHLKAKPGRHGSGKKRFGKSGDDLLVKVPLGTVVREGEVILAEMLQPGMRFVVARGGRGGRGNARFATPTDRAPRRYEPGVDGEERKVILELKSIADVGLVGFPNAGKSTLLTRLTAATPKIAAYPFTTKQPVLGVLQRGYDERLTLADIPGLIEGAHQGAGLGHRFLRHIERTKIIVHLVAIQPEETPDPDDLWERYEAIRREVASYSPQLATKPEIVVINKIDLADIEASEDLLKSFQANGIDPILASGITGEGLDKLTDRVFALAGERNAASESPE